MIWRNVARRSQGFTKSGVADSNLVFTTERVLGRGAAALPADHPDAVQGKRASAVRMVACPRWVGAGAPRAASLSTQVHPRSASTVPDRSRVVVRSSQISA